MRGAGENTQPQMPWVSHYAAGHLPHSLMDHRHTSVVTEHGAVRPRGRLGTQVPERLSSRTRDRRGQGRPRARWAHGGPSGDRTQDEGQPCPRAALPPRWTEPGALCALGRVPSPAAVPVLPSSLPPSACAHGGHPTPCSGEAWSNGALRSGRHDPAFTGGKSLVRRPDGHLCCALPSFQM